MIALKEHLISAAGMHAGCGSAREIGLLLILICP
jgi:hypothetical protein